MIPKSKTYQSGKEPVEREANLVGNYPSITYKRTLAACNRHMASRHALQCLTDLSPS